MLKKQVEPAENEEQNRHLDALIAEHYDRGPQGLIPRIRRKFKTRLPAILDRPLHLRKAWLASVLYARRIAARNDGLDEAFPEEEDLMKQWLRRNYRTSGPGRLYTLQRRRLRRSTGR